MSLYKISEIKNKYNKTLDKLSPSEQKTKWVFFRIPLFIGILFSTVGVLPTGDFLTGLISMLAILVGFTVNAGILLINYTVDENDRQVSDRKELKNDILSISTYSIVIGIFAIIFSGVILLGVSNAPIVRLPHQIGLRMLSVILYALLLHFMFTLLLLPSRLYAVITST